MTGRIQRATVCGAGAMGSGIAQIAAQSGVAVVVYDTSEQALETGRSRVRHALDGLVGRGRMTADEASAIVGRISWSTDLRSAAGSELVIEAIVESADIKGQLFAALEAVVDEQAILATNTSSLPISRLAKELRRPERFVGMHFFNPAPVMKLVEVIGGAATCDQVIEKVSGAAVAWGKVPVRVADVPGFIVNRVARPFYAEAFAALNERAAAPQVIDAFFRDGASFRMGPLELTDLIGQDVNFTVAGSIFESYFGRTRFTPQLAQGALVDAGRLGQKTGRGVYRHEDEPNARNLPAPEQAAPREGLNLSFDLVEVAGVLTGITRGRTAASEARDFGKPVALFDWCDEPNLLGFSASSDESADVALALATGAGATAYRVADRPGLIVLRTLAQIANAAADAALEHVADEEGIDAALRFGANYPFGLFSWADRIGRGRLAEILSAIADETGEGLYRPSLYWKRTV